MKNARSLLPAVLAALFALALPAAARVLSQEEIETAAANFLAYDDLARELLPGRTVSSVEPRDGQVQVFSHFRLELSVFQHEGKTAKFVDPRAVPLATSTRKVLAACGLL